MEMLAKPVLAAPPEQGEISVPRANAAPGLSLRHNFVWTFAGHAIYAACQWAVLVVIAKMRTPAAVGQFALGLAITAPILIFANQGLRDLQATDARQNFEFRHYLRYRLVSVLAAMAVVVILTATFAYPAVVVIVGLSKVLESILDLLYGQYQQHERMDWMATSFVLRGVLSVGAVAVLLRTTHSVAGAAAGLVVANAVVLAAYDWRRSRRFRMASAPHTDIPQTSSAHPRLRSTIFRLAILGLPLGLAQMLNSFSVNIPRYLLERQVGEASLGIFAAIMYLLVAGRTVIVALAQSCVARLAKLYADGRWNAFRSLLVKQIILALGFGAAGILFSLAFGAPFLRLIYGPEYAEYTGVLLFAMFIAALNHLAEFTGTALTAVRSISVQPVILGTCLVVGWVAAALFIPRYGIYGASIAVLAIAICQLVLYIGAFVYVIFRDNRQRAAGTAHLS